MSSDWNKVMKAFHRWIRFHRSPAVCCIKGHGVCWRAFLSDFSVQEEMRSRTTLCRNHSSSGGSLDSK
jgi:hypothetical protein